MGDGEMINQPLITDEGNTQTKYILGDIGNSGGETADHIHMPDGIVSPAPAVPFFKQYQCQENGHCDQQYFTISLHACVPNVHFPAVYPKPISWWRSGISTSRNPFFRSIFLKSCCTLYSPCT